MMASSSVLFQKSTCSIGQPLVDVLSLSSHHTLGHPTLAFTPLSYTTLFLDLSCLFFFFFLSLPPFHRGLGPPRSYPPDKETLSGQEPDFDMASVLLAGALLLASESLAAAASPPDVGLDYATLRGRVNDNDHSWEYLGSFSTFPPFNNKKEEDQVYHDSSWYLHPVQAFPLPKPVASNTRPCTTSRTPWV